MRRKQRSSTVLALVGLTAGILACNLPTPTSQPPSPLATPDTPYTSPLQAPTLPPPSPTSPSATSTPAPSPTIEMAPTPIPPGATDTPTPAEPETPPSTRPTLAPPTRPTLPPPASADPLDFPVPGALDGWRTLSDGRYEATIILRITGGAPPYVVHHEQDVFTTDAVNPAIVFTASGCDVLAYTIVVDSADGQSVAHDYAIPPPWCE